MTVNVFDPITTNDERLEKLQLIIDLTLETTQLRLADSLGYFCPKRSPHKDLGSKNQTELSFGLLTQKPTDTRKRFLTIPIGFAPSGLFVCAIRVKYADYSSEITGITINVYGLEYKQHFILLAEAIQETLNVPSINVCIITREPLYESS